MNICVFDTETTSINKPFCYNVGMVIANTETKEILSKNEWVIEQIWHNIPLFNSSYYAEKRPLYVDRMRARKIVLDKWGYVMQKIARIFKDFEVSAVYAYNSPFDERVFKYNCDWFKTQNPIEILPIFDIRGYVHAKMAWNPAFKAFCDEKERYTESGHYSTTAETVYQFIKNNDTFEEEHTALADSVIEWEILKYCIEDGLEWNTEYKVYSSIPRAYERDLKIIQGDNVTNFRYSKIKINKDKTQIVLD